MGCKEKGLRATRLTVGASNDLQMERNLTGGLPVLYQGHSANLDTFRKRFSPAHETRSERGDGRSESVGSRNGQRGKGPDASFEKHDDAMQMMTWQNATRKQMTWQRRRITGRHLAHRNRGVTVSFSRELFVTRKLFVPRQSMTRPVIIIAILYEGET